jgi:delta 1-pyrroline-5-carboxylate dehydrogenase
MRVKAENFTWCIRRHMGRVHVGMSDAAVEADIREAIEKSLKKNPEWQMRETTKRACVAYALQCHRKNQAVYRHVMSGSVTKGGN